MIFQKAVRIVFCLFCMLALAGAAQAGAQERKIAVAADGSDLDAGISSRTARAPYILIFNENGELLESHKNPVVRERGAGPAMARWLADKQIKTIIGGDIGANMAQALAGSQIQVVFKTGPVADAVREVTQ